MINTKLSASVVMFLTTAILSPASAQEITHWASQSVAADALATVSSSRPWTPGMETASRPWSAPTGHHQPRAIDVPTSASSFEQIFQDEDARVDRIVRNICKGC
jgi:hypothetical protein